MKGRITDDERRRAVELVESGKLSALEVADSLGITAGTFARWRRRFAGDNSVESRGVAASDVQPTGEPASQRESVLGPGRSRSSSASKPIASCSPYRAVPEEWREAISTRSSVVDALWSPDPITTAAPDGHEGQKSTTAR